MSLSVVMDFPNVMTTAGNRSGISFCAEPYNCGNGSFLWRYCLFSTVIRSIRILPMPIWVITRFGPAYFYGQRPCRQIYHCRAVVVFRHGISVVCYLRIILAEIIGQGSMGYYSRGVDVAHCCLVSGWITGFLLFVITA